MSLKDFVITHEEVTFRGGTISLRGLALNDVTLLVRDYLVELGNLFDMYENDEQRETAIAQSAQFAIKVVMEAPQLAAQVIVLASDGDQSDLPKASKMPLPNQVECIRKIMEITFEEAGGAKKFLGSLMEMVSVLRPTSSTEA